MTQQAIGAYFDGRDVVSWTRRPDGVREWRRTKGEHACWLKTADIPLDLRDWLQRSTLIKGRREEGDWTRVAFGEREHLIRCCSDRVAQAGVRGHAPGLFPAKGLQTYEADLHPIRRWLLEQRIEIAKPRRCYLDFEADSRVQLSPRKGNGQRDYSWARKQRVLTWTIGDDDGTYVQGMLEANTDEAERELLLDLLHELEPYDQVVGWYADEYDFPLFETRLEVLRLKHDLRAWNLVDYLPVFERMNLSSSKSGDEKQSMSLDSVANAVARVRKLEGVDGSMTWQLWSEDAAFLETVYRRAPALRGKSGREILGLYNHRDVFAMVQIESKKHYLDLHNTLSRAMGVFPDTAGANPLRYVDTFMLQLARDRGEHLPSGWGRPKQGEELAAYAGAYVMEPTRTGFIEGVHVADFAAMYPSIIRSWNMSPETLTDDVLVEQERPTYLLHAPPEIRPTPPGCCRTPNGTVFRTGTVGFLVLGVERLIELRAASTARKAAAVPGSPEYDEADAENTAYKQASNSFYGVVGCVFYRLYNRRVAEGITLTGQWMLKEVLARGEERHIRGIYGDTDSNFATETTEEKFAGFVDWLNVEHFPGELRAMGTSRCALKLAYEKAFEVLVLVGKKRYCCPPEAPVWMADLSFKPMGEIKVGDQVVGWATPPHRGANRTLGASTVVAVQRRVSPIVKVTMESGRTLRCTPDHLWLRARKLTSKRGDKFYSYEWQEPRPGRELLHIVDKPRTLNPEDAKAAAWLGGIWDGEGSLCNNNRGQIVITQSHRVNPEVCERIESSLRQLGFEYSIHAERGDGCRRYAIRGRHKQYKVDFLEWCNPAKGARFKKTILKSRFGVDDRIVDVVPDGEGEVVSLTTTTGNYVAWGYASKNCGRYAHYKGSRADETSKPEVKGLEYKRGDAAKMARRLQAEVLDLMMGGGVIDGKPRRLAYEMRIEPYVELVERWCRRVFDEPLALDDIKKAQRLTKDLREYVVKKKKDGEDAAQPPHVVVAKDLLARGIQLQQGSKIEYFVVDGEHNLKVAWAGDWAGECDRYYLWDDVVWPPTQRLLEAAFPEHPWKSYLQRARWKRSCKAVDRYVASLEKEYDAWAKQAAKAAKRANPDQMTLLVTPGSTAIH